MKLRVIIESKINSVTTHDAITYSHKAQTHKNVFFDLIKREIAYSEKIEEMIYSSRSKSRKQYYLLQKDLRLEEL